MFRKMRRTQRAIPEEAAKQLLLTERRGVLAVNGDDGYPYAVPVNFRYSPEEGKIRFHGARAGHKFDALQRDEKVCFTVYGNEQPTEDAWAPSMQSVVVFGRCRPVTDETSRRTLIKDLAMKYYPSEAEADAEIAADLHAATVYEISIEHLTGKQITEK